jgi:cytochrome c-type protein NapB
MVRNLPSVLAAAAIAALLSSAALAQEKKAPAAQTLRGAVPIPDSNPSGIYRMERHDRALPRAHAWQPPVIPHNIKGYQINKDVNMCMFCHNPNRGPQIGATVVGNSHYFDRDGIPQTNISARRYFCLQCHVPQFDAEPLVDNTFRKAN